MVRKAACRCVIVLAEQTCDCCLLMDSRVQMLQGGVSDLNSVIISITQQTLPLADSARSGRVVRNHGSRLLCAQLCLPLSRTPDHISCICETSESGQHLSYADSMRLTYGTSSKMSRILPNVQYFASDVCKGVQSRNPRYMNRNNTLYR